MPQTLKLYLLRNWRISLLYLIFLVSVFAVLVFHSDLFFKNFYFFNAGYRFQDLLFTSKLYEQFDVFFLIKNQGVLIPLENNGDDLGLYFLYPILIKFILLFNVSYPKAYVLLNLFVLSSFLVFNFYFIFKLISNFVLRIFSILFVLLFTVFCLYILDVYIWAPIFMAIVLPLLVLVRNDSNKKISFNYFLVAVLLIGFVMACSNQIRYGSALPFMLFIISGIFVYKGINNSRKIVLGLFFIAAFYSSNRLISNKFISLKDARNERMKKDFSIDLVSLSKSESKHVIWHSLVLGIGFDPQNPFGIKWKDTFGFEMFQTENPNMSKVDLYNLTEAYELFIKEYYFKLWRENPGYLLFHYFKKAIYSLLFIALALNVAPLLFFLRSRKGELQETQRKSLSYLLPFMIAILSSLAPAILVYPIPEYFLTGIYLSVILSIFVLCKFKFSESYL